MDEEEKQLMSLILGRGSQAGEEEERRRRGFECPSNSRRGGGEEDEQQCLDDDFGIAWEVLDTARVIYEKDTTLDSSIRASKLVDVYCSLGDLSMENGNESNSVSFLIETFEQAIPDYGKAIENQKVVGEASIDEKRALASLFFKQAMAYEYSNKSDPAIEALTKAKELLESCVKELESQDGKEPLGEYDPLSDLQSLIPEIVEKIQELRNGGDKGNGGCPICTCGKCG